MKELLILGAGHVGSRLHTACPEAAATRRNPPSDSPLLPFRIDDESTWSLLPPARISLITFALTQQETALRFVRQRLASGDVWILASTSCYAHTEQDQLITDDAKLDLGQARVQAEETARLAGATILPLAGIWDETRHPRGWLQRGLIRDGARQVNLVHSQDIVQSLLDLRPHSMALRGRRIIISASRPLLWRDIVQAWELPPLLEPAGNAETLRKNIQAQALGELLGPRPWRQLLD